MSKRPRDLRKAACDLTKHGLRRMRSSNTEIISAAYPSHRHQILPPSIPHSLPSSPLISMSTIPPSVPRLGLYRKTCWRQYFSLSCGILSYPIICVYVLTCPEVPVESAPSDTMQLTQWPLHHQNSHRYAFYIVLHCFHPVTPLVHDVL